MHTGHATDGKSATGGSTAPPPVESGDGASHRNASGRPGGGRGRRGQTTIDFAVGMSLFLITLSFVFVFVPGMLEPFSANTQSETPAANRVADDLVQRTLGDASKPYALDEQCTREFFTAGVPGDCHFDGDTTADRVGVIDRTSVNVTLSGDFDGDGESAMLCWDGSDDDEFVERGNADCNPGNSDDWLLARGPKPIGSGGKTVAATRVALLGDEGVTVEVVMW